MKFMPTLLTLCLVGCQSQSAPTPEISLPMAPPVSGHDARISARIGHYTLGAYVDPDNALIRHEAHAIQRVESAAYWDLRPAPLPRREPITIDPDVTPPAPADHPEPKSAPAVAISSPPTPIGDEQIRKAPERTRVVPLEPAITPDAAGLIDLTTITLGTDPDINPFAVRQIDPAAKREVTLQIGGIIHGPISCVLVNGQSMQTGDTVESLTLEDIEAHSVLFRYRDHLLRLPVAAYPTRLLLPR